MSGPPPGRRAEYRDYLTQQRHRREMQYRLTGVSRTGPGPGPRQAVSSTAVARPPEEVSVVAAAPPPPRVEPPRPPGFRLRVEGSDRSHSAALPDGTVFELRLGRTGIGRAPGSGIQLTDRHVSGVHAELMVGPGRLVVRDLGSTNGTFVNDERIGEPTTLGPGDRIAIGPDVFVVETTGVP